MKTPHSQPTTRATSLALAFGSCLLAACGDNRSQPPEHGAYLGPEPTPLACLPNLDGRIDASEVRPAIDVPISYLVSPPGTDRSVDLVGIESGGTLIWDYSVDYADDLVATVVPRAITDHWFAGSFPADAVVTPFDAEGRVVNVVRQDDQSLLLLGLASREPDPAEGQTLLIYDAPIELLRFPLAPATDFVSTGTIQNGTLRGLPYAGKDIYEISVDATGQVILPELAFTQAHRVRTRVTVQPAVGAGTSRRQVSFFFECFAEVLRVTSHGDEVEPDFTTAAEVRRIGF